MTDISDLKFDDKNFNKHTQRGMGLLEKSLQKLGAGRSILIDKDNNIIAGNGIVEAAGSVGLNKVKIIETDGTELIAVKRTDMALDSAEGREMALADNATAAADLEWDENAIAEASAAYGFDPDDWDVKFKPLKDIVEDDPDDLDMEHTYSVVGGIYQLGDHRVFCGSFEDDEKVRELFGGLKATCTFTDPPYNVAYQSADGKSIKNDKMEREAFLDFLSRAFETVAKNTVKGGV